MATTYMQAVNDILTETNEVELNAGNFSSTVGIQNYVKNAVNRAYLELCAKEAEWPFLSLAAITSQDPFPGNTYIETVPGTRWYLLKTNSASLAEDYSSIDWEGFYLTTQGVAGEVLPYDQEPLQYISKDDWLNKYAANENDEASRGEYDIPKRVIKSSDGRYVGLSPIPDKVYRLYFTAWVQPTKLVAPDDVFIVPDKYIPVLLHRARYYVHAFKENVELSDRAERDWAQGLREMRRRLMGMDGEYMRDDRVSL